MKCTFIVCIAASAFLSLPKYSPFPKGVMAPQIIRVPD